MYAIRTLHTNPTTTAESTMSTRDQSLLRVPVRDLLPSGITFMIVRVVLRVVLRLDRREADPPVRLAVVERVSMSALPQRNAAERDKAPDSPGPAGRAALPRLPLPVPPLVSDQAAYGGHRGRQHPDAHLDGREQLDVAAPFCPSLGQRERRNERWRGPDRVDSRMRSVPFR